MIPWHIYKSSTFVQLWVGCGIRFHGTSGFITTCFHHTHAWVYHFCRICRIFFQRLNHRVPLNSDEQTANVDLTGLTFANSLLSNWIVEFRTRHNYLAELLIGCYYSFAREIFLFPAFGKTIKLFAWLSNFQGTVITLSHLWYNEKSYSKMIYKYLNTLGTIKSIVPGHDLVLSYAMYAHLFNQQQFAISIID